MRNLEYLDEKLKGLSPSRRESIYLYLVGAASVLIEEKEWRETVDSACNFFDMGKIEEVSN